MGASKPETVHGRYEILRKIATGGMAELFVAKQVGMDGFEKVVALKRILSHLAFDEDFIAMFRDEARLVAKLNHPNIVQIYDLGKSDDSYFIAMEYIPGRNLSSVAKKARDRGERLPSVNIARCLAQVCEGLYYAHTRKDIDGRELEIIHRDVSPQNVIVSFSGPVKLVDFGIAKAASKVAHTRAGVLKGKYAYMSPEQIRGHGPIDARSDLFSVGIVLYELLCGQRPFEKGSSMNTLKAIVQEEPRPCQELNPDIPDRLAHVIHRCLEKDLSRRYADAQEVQLDLEDVVAESGQRCNSVTISQWVSALFEEELQRESGSMVVFQGVGEVILPDVPAPARPPIQAPSNRLFESAPALVDDLHDEGDLGRSPTPAPGGYLDDATAQVPEGEGDATGEVSVSPHHWAHGATPSHGTGAPDWGGVEAGVGRDPDPSPPEGDATIALPSLDGYELDPERSVSFGDQIAFGPEDLDLDDEDASDSAVAEGDATLAMPSVAGPEHAEDLVLDHDEDEHDRTLSSAEVASLYGAAEVMEGEPAAGEPTVGGGGGTEEALLADTTWTGQDLAAAGMVPDPSESASWDALGDGHTVPAPGEEPLSPAGPNTDPLRVVYSDDQTLLGVTGDLVERVDPPPGSSATSEELRLEPEPEPPLSPLLGRGAQPVAAVQLERREVPRAETPVALGLDDSGPSALFRTDPDAGEDSLEEGLLFSTSSSASGLPSPARLSHQDEYSALVAPGMPEPRAPERRPVTPVRPLEPPTPSRSRPSQARQIREVVRVEPRRESPAEATGGTPGHAYGSGAYAEPALEALGSTASPAPAGARALTAIKALVGIAALAAVTYLALLYFLPPEPLLEIATEPPGATLRLNGAVIPGSTPITLRLQPGVQYQLQLEREGFQTVADEVSVTPDQGRTSYRVRLEPRP